MQACVDRIVCASTCPEFPPTAQVSSVWEAPGDVSAGSLHPTLHLQRAVPPSVYQACPNWFPLFIFLLPSFLLLSVRERRKTSSSSHFWEIILLYLIQLTGFS